MITRLPWWNTLNNKIPKECVQRDREAHIKGTQIGMFRPIRMDHTNCLQVAIKTLQFNLLKKKLEKNKKNDHPPKKN